MKKFNSRQLEIESHAVTLANRRTLQDFKQLIGEPATTTAELMQKNNRVAVLDDYQPQQNLPKIKQKLLSLQPLKPSAPNTTTANQVQRPLKLPEQTFYSAFNFSVLHSKQREFLIESEYTPRRSLKSMHLAGGDNRWQLSKSVLSMRKTANFASGFQALVPRTGFDAPTTDLNSYREQSETVLPLRLNKFENLMSESETRKMPPQHIRPVTKQRKLDRSLEQDVFAQGSICTFDSTIPSQRINNSKDHQQNSILTFNHTTFFEQSKLSANQTTSQFRHKNPKHPSHNQLGIPVKKKSRTGKAADVEKQVMGRETQLKRRPKFRFGSAGSKGNRALRESLLKQGLVHYTATDSASSGSHDPSTRKMSSEECKEEKDQLHSQVAHSLRPRMGHLLMRPETEDFRIQLGHFRFEKMLANAITDQDRKVISLAYQNFISALQQQDQKTNSSTQITTQSDSESDQSVILEEDGGPPLAPAEFMNNNKLLGAFVKAISRKLLKYTQKLQRDMDNAQFADRLSRLNITQLQAELDTEKTLIAKRQPIKGDDLTVTSLSLIYRKQAKSQNIDQLYLTHLRDYTELLQGFGINYLQEVQKPKLVRRGFIMLADQQNYERVNIEEMIPDPSQIFDRYLSSKRQHSLMCGQDFQRRHEFAKLSSVYNFNSTLLEEKPTANTQFIKHCNAKCQLALPLLAKIKNKELILSDYRLELAHYEALLAACASQPDILEKITLNNCGVDSLAMRLLIKVCLQLLNLKHLQVVSCAFDLESVQLMQGLLKRPNFVVLRLIDCVMQPQTADYFFISLSQKSYLQRLSLSGFHFTENSYLLFIQYFKRANLLEELILQNVKGLRPQNWAQFMTVLSQNKGLSELDLSWNNLIENQEAELAAQLNPYKLFKKVYQQWIKLGTGAKWPGPESVIDAIKRPRVVTRKTTTKKQLSAVPFFSKNDAQDNIILDNSVEDMEAHLKEKLTIQVVKLMKQSIRQAIAIAFMKPVLKKDQKKPEAKPAPPLLFGEAPFENQSAQAHIVTEAIYKFIRRNTNLQHLNLSSCNLGQVMLARIALGVKCSGTLMSAHFSNNPGVTAPVKAFLQVKMKAVPPQPKSIITTDLIEQDQNLHETLINQLDSHQGGQESLAQDTISLREIKRKKWDPNNTPQDPITAESKTLILTRLLGHKREIPGSGRWQILTSPKDECWICQKHVYALFLWSPQQVPHCSLVDQQTLLELVEQDESEGVLISGHFTNWQPRKMYPVQEFIRMARPPQAPDFLAMVKQMDNLPDKFDYYDLSADSKYKITELKREYTNNDYDNWQQHIGGMTKFKDCQFVNYEHLINQNVSEVQSDSNTGQQIYCYPALVKPGKNYYLVRNNRYQRHRTLNSEQSQQYSALEDSEQLLYKSILPLREDLPLPKLTKKLFRNEFTRVFDRERSVFKPWKQDTKSSLDKTVELDLNGMNLGKLIKDDSAMDRMITTIKRNIGYLKQCHLDLISDSSNPPYVNSLDFVNLYKKCQFEDETLKAASLDLIHVQVLTNCKTRTAINRGELIEALIRVAKAKYVDRGVCSSLDEALQLLIDQKMRPNWGDSQWHPTRQTKFWTVEVNDILEVNLEPLKKVFTLWWDLKGVVKKKWMEMREADYFMTQAMPDLKLTTVTARKCFIMSKMTTVDELSKIDQYNKMVFVEFLEMLCRMALYHFDETPMRELTLTQRLECVLENVLLLKSLERKPVVQEVFVDSDADISDDDY